MPDRSLDSLSGDFYPLACELIARVVARGVAVMVVQTGRTLKEQEDALNHGTSGTRLSLHLPRYLRWNMALPLIDPNKVDAIDLVPYEIYQHHGPDKVQWDGLDPAFGVIGEEAERLGLRWGGRWLKPYDPGHAEYLLPWKEQYIADERARPWPKFRNA
jgi:D-alanyl-D-alanine carboxypeptidase